MRLPFFTVGHSNHSIEELAALLCAADIDLLVDIRKFPRSRANPQFNCDTLPDALAAVGISYEHDAALGGRRAKSSTLSPAINGFWTNDSFHNYADYALSVSFQAGLEHLLEEGRQRRSAIMCSEVLWWRCHRRIVADYLIARGETVSHIMGSGRLELAHLTAGAVIRHGGALFTPTSRPRTDSPQRTLRSRVDQIGSRHRGLTQTRSSPQEVCVVAVSMALAWDEPNRTTKHDSQATCR